MLRNWAFSDSIWPNFVLTRPWVKSADWRKNSAKDQKSNVTQP